MGDIAGDKGGDKGRSISSQDLAEEGGDLLRRQSGCRSQMHGVTRSPIGAGDIVEDKDPG